MCIVMSDGPISVTFPNQFQLGNPENEPRKLVIHFDDLLVESIQRKSFRQVQKGRKAERLRQAKKRDGPSKDHQPNEEDVTLIRKQESNHKKVMKLLKGMINMHNHDLGLQGVDNELNDLQLQSSDIHL